MYLKVIGVVHVIFAFLKVLLLLKLLKERWLLRVLVLLRRLSVYSRTHGQKQGNNINIHAYKG